MHTATTILEVSPCELAYLAGAAGTGPLVGVPDPFVGWLTEEKEEALAQARGALISRGLVTAESTVAPDVLTVVRACFEPGVSFRLVTGDGLQRHFYPGLELEEDEGLLRFAVVADLAGRAWELLALDGREQGSGSGEIAEAALHHSLQLAAGGRGDDARVLLEEAGLNGDLAGALLEGSVHSSAVVSFVRDGAQWLTDGLGFLHGAAGLWLMHPAGDDRVRLVPAEPQQAREALARLISVVESFRETPEWSTK